MRNYLKVNRSRIDFELGAHPRRRLFSPGYYSQYKVTLPLLRQYASGRLLDIGCGSMPFKPYIESQVACYDTLEIDPGVSPVTYIGDVQDMTMIDDCVYDTVLSLEVLEHVPNPILAAKEVFRVLKPGGHFIVSVPHLSRLHMEPHDYYRFTRYGMDHLLREAGFEVPLIANRGGLFSFLGNQVANLILSAIWPIPGARSVAWLLNGVCITRLAYWIDEIVRTSSTYPMGITAVACRPTRDTNHVG